MAPKTPAELKDQIEKQNEQSAEPGHERTSEGKEVETPKRGDFLRNLEKASKPEGEKKK
jgi:hypothetical protein